MKRVTLLDGGKGVLCFTDRGAVIVVERDRNTLVVSAAEAGPSKAIARVIGKRTVELFTLMAVLMGA